MFGNEILGKIYMFSFYKVIGNCKSPRIWESLVFLDSHVQTTQTQGCGNVPLKEEGYKILKSMESPHITKCDLRGHLPFASIHSYACQNEYIQRFYIYLNCLDFFANFSKPIKSYDNKTPRFDAYH